MTTRILKRPIAVTMCIIALCVLGILASLRLPVSLMPDIDVPQITVQVSCPGHSAREVEGQYIGMLRGQLQQVDGVASLRSESRADAGSVRLVFEPGQDMDLLFIAVNEKIDRAMNYMPKGSDRPKVIKAGAMDIPAFYLDISLKDSLSRNDKGGTTHRFAELGRFARGVVSKRVEQLPQTAMVDMSGTAGTEIVCIPDVQKMTAMGITHRDLENAITSSNIRLEALSVVDGIYRYHIHFDAQLLTKEDVGNVYLRHEGRLLQQHDLCTIEERMQEPTGIVRHNGQRAIALAIIKQSDARMDDLKESMQTLLDDLRKEYPDIDFELTRDQTELLSFTMDNLRSNLIVGAVLASIILLVFMRQWRLSMLVVVSIPLSLVLTLLGFDAMGVSMNVISLSGLILGVGMIVDNAIIVIDNVCRRWQGGESIAEATSKGTREVFVPMLSSVLTTCSVFVPLVFLSGTAGALFYDQAVGITLSLFASLAVAAIVVPVYFFAMYRRRDVAVMDGKKSGRWGRLPMLWYERTLGHVLRHAGWYLLLATVCMPLTAFVLLHIEKERMPQLPHHDALLRIDWNAGISARENDHRVTQLMEGTRGMWHSYTSMCGTQEFILSHTPDISQNEAVVYVDTHDEGALEELLDTLNTRMWQLHPQAALTMGEASNIFSLMFSTNEADLEIHLHNSDGNRPTLAQSRNMVDTLRAHFPDVRFTPVEVETDIRLVADMERMALHRISYSAMLARLKALVNQGSVMEINDGAQSVPVILGSESMEAERLLGETVMNEEGTPVPLYMLVRRTQGEEYKRLEAGTGGAFYCIDVDVTDRQVGSIMNFVDEYVDKRGTELSVNYDGDYFSARRLIAELAVVLCVALALLYFILAAQFESLMQPLIILAEIVVDVFFIALALWALGVTLNVMSMIGLVVVSGIVINDSILKVDTINGLRNKGAPPVAAVVRAGHWRLRPIVMTSLTTILAIIPSLFQNDMGSALQYPLSITIVVGMSIGTLVSLFFIPLMYLRVVK